MMNPERLETVETYCLAFVGAVCGVFNYYIKPLPNDALTWLAGRLVDFEIPDQETIDQHIRDNAL